MKKGFPAKILLNSVLISTFCLLLGCESTGHNNVFSGSSQTAYQANPALSLDERFRLILALLASGEPAKAKIELTTYMEKRSDSEVANNLLAQIDTPADVYFPADYYPITLGSGESLSTLAKYKLADVYQYYALAKYNGIEKPKNIKIGDVIKIPLTKEAQQILDGELITETRSTSTESETLEIELLKTTAANLSEPSIESKIIPGETLPVAAKLELLIQNKQYLAAIALIEAEHGGDQTLLLKQLKVMQADEYHREAALAYRKQALDQAIALWDKAIALDPEHANARIYRVQAVELKEKLFTIK